MSDRSAAAAGDSASNYDRHRPPSPSPTKAALMIDAQVQHPHDAPTALRQRKKGQAAGKSPETMANKGSIRGRGLRENGKGDNKPSSGLRGLLSLVYLDGVSSSEEEEDEYEFIETEDVKEIKKGRKDGEDKVRPIPGGKGTEERKDQADEGVHLD